MSGAGGGATPLVALDAVFLDTETTSLDPREARIVQIAAISMRGGAVDEDDRFETLVDPGIPVPARSTEIHGLKDGDLAEAPTFAETFGKLDTFIGDRLVIGHNIGYDLAVLKAEQGRAGLPWRLRRALDTRLLGQLAAPDAADFSLDGLAHRLGVTVDGRHSAAGDARAAAAIFLALLPDLRQRNIRTLAEAEAACSQLVHVLEVQHKAGWVVPERHEKAAIPEGALSRIDAYPYRHRIREIMSAPPIIVQPDMPMREALKLMTDRRVSSIFIGPAQAGPAGDYGILTERDVMRAMAGNGDSILAEPVSSQMSGPLESVPEDAFLYLAIGRMARLKVRHLGVADEDGRLVGALSQRDLLRLRASEAISLGDEILVANSAGALAAAWSRRSEVARALLAEGVSGRQIAAVISRGLCSIARRAALLCEERMAEAGRGAPPVPYTLLVLGSGGRGESLLTADQDNAIVYADVPERDAETVDAWFADLGRHIADVLDEAGIPYCKGGVMAMNAAWRGSVANWKARADQWVRRQHPEDLLNVDIFFDLAAVHGEAAPAREIRDHAWEAGRRSAGFAKLLAEAAAGFKPPVGLFGGLKTENGRIDLKMGGLFVIVAAARCLAIRHGIVERDTPSRLAGVRRLGLGAENDLARLDETQALLMDLILAQQLADIERGLPPTNKVDLTRLPRRQVDRLKRALNALGTLDETVRDLLFAR